MADETQIAQLVGEVSTDSGATQIAQFAPEVSAASSETQIAQLSVGVGTAASGTQIAQVTILLGWRPCVPTGSVLDRPAGTAEGDHLLVVLLPDDQNAQVIAPENWIVLFPCENNPEAALLPVAVLLHLMGPGEPDTYEFMEDGGAGAVEFGGKIAAVAYRNLDPSVPPVDGAEMFSFATDGIYTLPSVTTEVINSVLVGIVTQSEHSEAPIEFAAPAGYVKRLDTGYIMICDRIGSGVPVGPTGDVVGLKTVNTVGENTYHFAFRRLAN